MKKVLIASYENPFTRFAGDEIYTCNLLQAFHDLGWAVSFLYYDSNEFAPLLPKEEADRMARSEAVPFRPASKLDLILSLQPGMIVNRRRADYTARFEAWLREDSYDLVVLNHQKMTFLAVDCKIQPPVLYFSHNAEYLLSKNTFLQFPQGLQKWLYGQDALKTRWFERKMLRKVQAVTAICEHDERYFKEQGRSTAVLRPVLTAPAHVVDNLHNSQRLEILIVGSFTWGPKAQNVLQFLEAYHKHRLAEEGMPLWVVGKMSDRIKAIVEQRYPSVKATGRVDDLEEYYDRCAIAVVPEVLGGGFKLKVAEAALRGKAIFAVKGAITECNFKSGVHFHESVSFDELANDILHSRARLNYIRALGKNALRLSQTEYSQRSFNDQLERHINTL